MRANGASLHEIHDWALTLTDEERGGRNMGWQMFHRMFGVGVYVARPEYPRGHPDHDMPVLDRPRGRWEPLVSDELFRRCLEVAERGRRIPKQASGKHLLLGLLRCPRCGSRMAATTIRRNVIGATGTRRRESVEYRCAQRYAARRCAPRRRPLRLQRPGPEDRYDRARRGRAGADAVQRGRTAGTDGAGLGGTPTPRRRPRRRAAPDRRDRAAALEVAAGGRGRLRGAGLGQY